MIAIFASLYSAMSWGAFKQEYTDLTDLSEPQL